MPAYKRLSQYQPYLAGPKRYGAGRDMPTLGPVDPLGYRERDAKVKAKQNAIRNRMKANKDKKYARQDLINPLASIPMGDYR